MRIGDHELIPIGNADGRRRWRGFFRLPHEQVTPTDARKCGLRFVCGHVESMMGFPWQIVEFEEMKEECDER